MMRRGSDMAGRDKKTAIDKIMIYVSSNAVWHKAPYLSVDVPYPSARTGRAYVL